MSIFQPSTTWRPPLISYRYVKMCACKDLLFFLTKQTPLSLKMLIRCGKYCPLQEHIRWKHELSKVENLYINDTQHIFLLLHFSVISKYNFHARYFVPFWTYLLTTINRANFFLKHLYFSISLLICWWWLIFSYPYNWCLSFFLISLLISNQEFWRIINAVYKVWHNISLSIWAHDDSCYTCSVDSWRCGKICCQLLKIKIWKSERGLCFFFISLSPFAALSNVSAVQTNCHWQGS